MPSCNSLRAASRAASGEGLLLRDGRRVRLRPTRAADATRIRRLFDEISPQSRSSRFGYARAGLMPAEAERFALPPGPAGVAVLALSETDAAVGLARYDRGPLAAEAEFSIVVHDAWQGDCLGDALLRDLAARAADDGLASLWAQTDVVNVRALSMLRSAGWTPDPRDPEYGGVRLRLRLSAPSGAGLDRGMSPVGSPGIPTVAAVSALHHPIHAAPTSHRRR